MILFKLFLSFLQIGLFSFGGGYAALPLIENQVITINNWLSQEEFIDIVSISQMTPGPIAINAATFVGQKVAGLPGALVATLGSILPSCIILITIAHFYVKFQNANIVQSVLNGLRPAVVALIASACISIVLLTIWPTGLVSFTAENVDLLALGLIVIGFILLRRFKFSPTLFMLFFGAAGFIIKYLFKL
ncbi:MAG TPA: chromate transporter [Clostridiales bacterium]|nr:chromate transporter [Clostridiales bacterium]